MDRALRIDIMETVRSAMQKVAEESEEVWLSEDELLRTFQFLSPGWMKKYRNLLPRTQAVVREIDGREHSTGWAYPRNEIQRWIRSGKIKQLKNYEEGKEKC